MKYVWFVIFFMMMLSCKTIDKTLARKSDNFLNACPEEGNCSFKLLKNKSLNILTDNLGELYTKINEGDNLVLVFEYEKNMNLDLQDSGYKEQIFIELNPNALEIETYNLKTKKLVFARLCYCKGQTGYYKIKKGNLSIKKVKNKNYHIMLNFKVDEVPQVISTVNQVFSLK
ncbi:hypothetical protein [Tenacibaculum sp.]|uniref:hypothetical protein n=1 Tax=Tenacibaculum sp. TaxID=1906242 RepID=UPI003D10060E